ncbi:MAG TPA: hypothetical protein VFM05_06540, partial [Candidatus Saccharimonadales bacterium]|nr:hypothetical protein [Candidatus Saccharimonadales bacterium]
MDKRTRFLTWLILIMSFALSGCMGLIPLEDEPVAGEFGPRLSPQEQQTQTFEALWEYFETNYI